MCQGRGIAAVVTVLLLCMLLHCKNADAASYTVGDAAGWTFNVQNWPKGKSFKAGDVLGKYEQVYHVQFLKEISNRSHFSSPDLHLN